MISRVAKTTVFSFLLLILCGTALLLHPGCRVGPGSLGFVEALFTATSAVCVTGLIVVDTGSDLTLAGQSIVLFLLQLGGLGILTLSTLVMLSVRAQTDLASRLYVDATHGIGIAGLTARQVVRRVVGLTVTLEAAGALILFLRIGARGDAGWNLHTAWVALFHSVSAFCNAGFSLHSDSLDRYRSDPITSLVLMSLIVAGGLGFLVLSELIRFFRRTREERSWWRLSLHTRLVVGSSALLIVTGAVLYVVFESRNTLATASPIQHLLDPVFYSVTCRTAGFNTVSFSSMTSATLVTALMLMLIGASPGSTGGGVKTTTIAVLLAMTRARLRGRPHAELLGRRLAPDQTAKAIATLAAFIGLVFLAGLLLQITEVGPVAHDQSSAHYLDHLFEIVSALGTVGLSTGVTGELSNGGRLIIIVLMFLGRLGPLVVGASLIGEQSPLPMTYPEERILVG